MSEVKASTEPWNVEFDQAYNGRPFWTLWRKNDKWRFNQEFMRAKNGGDKKRFYSKEKAEAFAKKLNAQIKEPA